MESKNARLEVTDSSSHGAALLLMKVRNIAMTEVVKGSSAAPRRPCMIMPHSLRPATETIKRATFKIPEDSVPSDLSIGSPVIGYATTTPRSRFRTVSMESMEEYVTRVVPPSPFSGMESDDELSAAAASTAVPVSPCHHPVPHGTQDHHRDKQHVGTDMKSPLRGVLRKKYAWREFPELEGYLIEHRDQYLSFSSQLNYTAEQKRYNNQLTQGLLDLASEQGYLFEGFTFAMIRDRIRCYYKSYVQAVKKKKRKKKLY